MLLEGILLEQLPKLNRIHIKDKKYHFFKTKIHEVLQTLKNIKHNGLQKAYEIIYLLILFTSGIAFDPKRKRPSVGFALFRAQLLHFMRRQLTAFAFKHDRQSIVDRISHTALTAPKL